MSDCLKCNASISSGDRVCPACGAPSAPEQVSAEPKLPDGSDAVHQHLLSANLLRIRGNLDEAIQECIKGLRVDPDNVAAHSLLGDIYRSQGKIEDALRWYKLALDISPSSTQDRARLDRLTQDSVADIRLAHGDIFAPAERKFGPLTVGIIFVALFAMIMGALWTFARRSQTTQNPTAAARQIGVTITPTPDQYESTSQSDRHEASGPGPVKPAAAPERTDRETVLLKELNASQTVADNSLHIGSVTVDPRDNSAIITYSNIVTDQALVPNAMLRNSLRVGKEAFLLDGLLSRIQIRVLCVMADGSGARPEVVFVGDLRRETASQIQVDSASYPEEVSAFENPWWHQDVRR